MSVAIILCIFSGWWWHWDQINDHMPALRVPSHPRTVPQRVALYDTVGVLLSCLIFVFVRTRSLSQLWPQCVLFGLLAFISVSVELRAIFSAVSGLQPALLSSVLFASLLVLLLLVGVSVSLALYWTLNAEEYRWHWRAVWVAAYVPFVCCAVQALSFTDSLVRG